MKLRYSFPLERSKILWSLRPPASVGVKQFRVLNYFIVLFAFILKLTIFIDGFTSPTKHDRLCLGNISNPTRDAQVRMTRTHIGKGFFI